MTCKARQYSDQMQCGRCGLAWDVNDPEPPACSPVPTNPPPRQKARAVFKALRRSLQK